MVEGASIDKQSHPNQAAGTIWDTIELDKAIGVARTWAAKRATKDTLIVVTADHDQSMGIIGVSNTPDTEYFDRSKSEKSPSRLRSGDQDFTVCGDSYSNARAGLPFINTSTTASNNGGAAGMPGTFAPTTRPMTPGTSTYSTYCGSPAYKLDAATGYPVNSGAGHAPPGGGFPHRRPYRFQRSGHGRRSGRVPLHRLHGSDRHLLQDGGGDILGHFRCGQVGGHNHQ